MLDQSDQTCNAHQRGRLRSASVFLTSIVAAIVLFAACIWSAHLIGAATPRVGEQIDEIVELRGAILHLDEVLTMSARLHAATGDAQWRERYEAHEPVLDETIGSLIDLSEALLGESLGRDTDAANLALVDLERQSFALVEQGRASDAALLLLSPEYERLKAEYSAGMQRTIDAVERALSRERTALTSMALVSLTLATLALPVMLASGIRSIRVARTLERQRNERASLLREATLQSEIREQSRSLVEASHATEAIRRAVDIASIVAITDRKGVITHVNDNFCEVSGYSRDELLGSTHALINSSYHPDSFFEDLYRTIHSGKTWRGVVRNRRKNGTFYWVDSTVVPMPDAHGEVREFIALRTDITSRVEAEHELEHSNLALSEVTRTLDAASDCVFIFDAATMRFLYANHGAVEQVGWTAEELSWMAPWEITPLIDENEFRELIAPMLAGELASTRFETLHQHRHGRTFPVQIFLEFVRDIGEQGRFIAIVRDVSEQKAREQELERAKDEAVAASAAKGEFLANMSHEIRTPMTAILGFADLLDEQLDGDLAGREYLDTIRNNGVHLLTIINDILDISKIEAGKMTVERVACDPVQLLEDVVSACRVRAAGKGVDLRLRFAGGMPSAVLTDPVRLRQVLVNVVGNAVKFTEIGNVTVTASMLDQNGELLRGPGEDGEETRSCLRVEVVDTGVGVSEEQLRRLFQPFSQADNSTTRRFGGTGLGLQISRRLAQMLGGDVALKSPAFAEPAADGSGPGARAIVEVAADAAPEASWHSCDDAGRLVVPSKRPLPADARPAVALSSTPLADRRILLAEDGPDNQRLIAFHLRKAGAHVQIADNGRIAVDLVNAALAEGAPFDLVLMDMQMPELDGYGATRQLRRAGVATPIVALTAHAMAGDRDKCINAGCNDYATKPIDRDALIDACASQIARSRAA